MPTRTRHRAAGFSLRGFEIGRTLVLLTAWVLLGVGPARAADVTIGRVTLITVTDATAVLTWETDQPADTAVRYRTGSSQLDQLAASDESVRFHYCGLRGLRPGTRYHYVCQSGTARASANGPRPGRFTTLAPPPGEELFSFATLTDTHVGEQRVARLVLSPDNVISEGVRWRDPDLPFWQLTAAASIDEINERGVAFTIIKGDLTHHGSVEELHATKRLLDRLNAPYRVVRGNHDRLEPLLRTFGLTRSWYAFDHAGVHFVVLDTEPFASKPGPKLEAQLAWLADDLEAHGRQRTFVFVHRPIPPRLTRASGPLADGLFKLQRDVVLKHYGARAAKLLEVASGRSACVREPNARRLAELLASHGRIAGVFAGHLHRNYVGTWPEQTGSLPYVETAATKEYPCGYAITRVFTGGYMHSFYTPRDPRCLEWSAQTADAYAGIGWGGKAGAVADRNFVVRYDTLRIEPTTTRAAATRPGR